MVPAMQQYDRRNNPIHRFQEFSCTCIYTFAKKLTMLISGPCKSCEIQGVVLTTVRTYAILARHGIFCIVL